MRRVVVTGMGIVSCLGNTRESVLESLRLVNQASLSMRISRKSVCAAMSADRWILTSPHIDRKVRRFMGDAAAYAYVAMQKAIDDAGLTDDEVSNTRTGLIAGSGGASSASTVLGADKLRERGVRRVGPYVVPKAMSSTVSACLATHFAIRGLNYSITSACATSSPLHRRCNGANPVG